MKGHSPGPWRTGGIFDPGTPRERMNVWGPTSVGMQSGQIVAENARPADAKLIAAAPALADALEDLIGVKDPAGHWQDIVARATAALRDAGRIP